jgi:hypothetical protein
MGLVNTFGGLVAMRVLLGLFEAGLFPGMLVASRARIRVNSYRVHLPYLHVLQTIRAAVASYPLFHS